MTSPTYSFWEHQTFLGPADAVVVGAGIVGLTAAIYLQEQRPDWRVLVLERDALPNGASTKNAGFACFGSVSELIEQEKKGGPEELLRVVSARWAGLQRLRALVGDEALGYEAVGGYELFRDTASERALADDCLDRLAYYNELLAPVIGPTAIYQPASVTDFSFRGLHAVIANPHEGALDTGRMMLALLRRAWAAGVVVLAGMPVLSLEPEGAGRPVAVRVPGAAIQAGRVLVATNALAGQFFPELDVVPGRNQVLVTEPLPNLPPGTFHYDRGYTYFRALPSGRLLLGGGRNLAPTAEQTSEQGLTPLIQDYLETLLTEVIVPGQRPRIDYRWSGVLAFGAELAPIVREVRPGIVAAVRCNGMGVALGAGIGWQAAALLNEVVAA